MSWIRAVEGGVGVEIDVVVVPRSSKNRIVGEHDGRLKVQLNAAPVDGEANAALIELLAKRCGIKRKEIEIVSGETGRRKRVRLNGISIEGAAAVLGTVRRQF